MIAATQNKCSTVRNSPAECSLCPNVAVVCQVSIVRAVGRSEARVRYWVMGWTPPDGIDVPKWRC